MRAAYLVSPGQIEIRDVDSPKPGKGEVVINVECALTCGTDLKAFRRGHPFIPMPGRFGHQYAGRVAALGEDVGEFEVGEPILGVHSGPCGDCKSCRKGRFNLCLRFSEQLVLGAFAEQLVIRERVVRQNLHRRPEGLSPVRAAFLEPVSCVQHTLRLLDWRGVDRVLVLGLGSMGLLFVEVAPFFSEATVVAAGRRKERIEMARQLGAQVLDIDEAPLRDHLADDPGFDLIIECTGRPEGWQQALEHVLPGGQVMLFGGLPKGTTFPIDTFRLHYEELRVLGSFHFTPDDVLKATELLVDPRLRLEEMVRETLPLDQLESALIRMSDGDGIKYAIEPAR